MIDRRSFNALIGATALLPCRAAVAQQARVRVIGILGSATAAEWTDRLKAFSQGLAEGGYVEGRNLRFEYRWANGSNARLPALAAELVAQKVDAIAVLGSTASAIAAKGATTTIPIVFRLAADPVSVGLAASLSRPGGNLTGVTTLGVEVGAKQVEMLREIVPEAKTIALLVNPTNPVLANIQSTELTAAARGLGLEAHIAQVGADSDFEPAFARMEALKIGGLIIGADTFFNTRNEVLAGFTLKHKVPAISPYREFVQAGGLVSYGGNISEASRLAASYAIRVLNGEKPAELPIQQVTRVELAVNAKSAKVLGITLPQSLMVLADEVIE